MFSLIISIISIALVAALAAATVYFGGAAFNKGGAGADASTFINASQQVAGAFTLAATDGFASEANSVAKLANGTLGESSTGALDGEIYLSQVPSYKGTSLELASTAGLTNYVTVSVSTEVCNEIVKRTGVVAPADAAAVISSKPLYTCVADTAYYKVK